MDSELYIEENDAPFLIDSGTESITESPLGTEHSQDSTLCDINVHAGRTKTKSKLSSCLIDKSLSIDEDELCTPLQPTLVRIFHLDDSNFSSSITSEDTSSEEDDGIEDFVHIEVDKKPLIHQLAYKDAGIGSDNSEKDAVIVSDTPRTSILRKSTCFQSPVDANGAFTSRHICFPSDERQLVSYREPEDYQWVISDFISSEEILNIYQSSCKKHNTIELDTIKSQIREIKNNMNHSATLKLSAIKISVEVTETLEDILKVANFNTLILQECEFTPQTMTEFLNSLQYYNSVCHFEIAMNFDDDDTWRCFCSACSHILALKSLSFKGMKINEPYMRHLIGVVKNNQNISMLKFDECMLVNLPTFYLVESLMTNRTIRELYLPSTGLYTKEAEALQRFLVNNTHLKVLDISNNNLGDRGLEVLSKGLCSQKTPGVGLSVLVIFNNQISEKSGGVIKNIIVECKNLHTLNIGYNNLTDEVLCQISDGLSLTESLEGLGLQCTLLTCRGIIALAEAIPNNISLHKINLKGNKAIQIQGIEALCSALTKSKITKIEIDDFNRSCNDPEVYATLVKKLNAICTINKNYVEESDGDEEREEVLNISQKISRKMSLSCEPKFATPDPNTTFQNLRF